MTKLKIERIHGGTAYIRDSTKPESYTVRFEGRYFLVMQHYRDEKNYLWNTALLNGEADAVLAFLTDREKARLIAHAMQQS